MINRKYSYKLLNMHSPDNFSIIVVDQTSVVIQGQIKEATDLYLHNIAGCAPVNVACLKDRLPVPVKFEDGYDHEWDLATCHNTNKKHCAKCHVNRTRNYGMATKFVENKVVVAGVSLRHVDNTKKKYLSKFDGNRTRNGEVMAWRRNLAKTRWWRWE